MNTQFQSVGKGQNGAAAPGCLTMLSLVFVFLLALDSMEAWAGSYVQIDPYPLNGPRKTPDITGSIGDSVTLDDTLEVIDILILGDGFLAAESTRFIDTLAQKWYDSTFGSASAIGIRPYTFFPQAFRVRAVWEPSANRASSARQSHYRVKIDPADTSVDGGSWYDGASEANRGFRDSVFKSVDQLPDPKDTTRYPANLDNKVKNIQIIQPMADVYSNLYIVMLIRASGDKNPSGRARTVKKYEEPQRVRAGLGALEVHEFGHAFGYLKDEYIDNRSSTDDEGVNPDWDEISVFNLLNLHYSGSRCDEVLLWPHLAPGGEHNPSLSSLIGNAFMGGVDEIGVFHSEYKCLINGKHENYFCDLSGSNTNLRDKNNMCFWCEELAALRMLERTGQLKRPGDPADINDKGKTWFTKWDDSLRDAYYERFSIDSLIVLKDSCYDLSCPSCSTSCAATAGSGLPTCIAECDIRDVIHAIFVDGDNGNDFEIGSSLYPKETILIAVSVACAPQYLIMIKTASYPGAITITQPATLVAGGCSSVIIGK